LFLWGRTGVERGAIILDRHRHPVAQIIAHNSSRQLAPTSTMTSTQNAIHRLPNLHGKPLSRIGGLADLMT